MNRPNPEEGSEEQALVLRNVSRHCYSSRSGAKRSLAQNGFELVNISRGIAQDVDRPRPVETGEAEKSLKDGMGMETRLLFWPGPFPELAPS
jgi:hypothetical protein